MRKSSLKFFSILVLSLFVDLAWAVPESLPAGAKVTCVANQDLTGVLTIEGATVKRVEVYYHNPDGTTKNRAVLETAATYAIPRFATFNFVFANAKGEERYVLVGSGDTPAQITKVFANVTSAGSSTFNGVSIVPDARHGGIGGPGASLGCTHMLRAKTAAK